MIVKHMPMQTAQSSSISRLATYITSSIGKQERVGEITITNCVSTDVSAATLEIEHTQSLNKRAKSAKTYHLLISFPAGEKPSQGALRVIEQELCASLGFGGHQRISAMHSDTDNLHVHVAINKIHPTTFNCHTPKRDHFTLAETSARLEKQFGLMRVDRSRKLRVGEGRARDMEQAGGTESLLGWMQRNAQPALQAATTWQEFGEALAARGLGLQARNAGFVFVDAAGNAVKASSVSRDFSKAKLEAAFGNLPGEAVGLPTVVNAHYKRGSTPSRIDTSALYQKYQEQKQGKLKAKIEDGESLRLKRQLLLADLSTESKLKKLWIKALPKSPAAKRVLYVILRKKQSERMAEILSQLRDDRRANASRSKLPTWHDWLQQEARHDPDALAALRARKRGLQPKAWPVPHIPGLVVDGVTKQGTVIYRAGDTTLRDDGARLVLSSNPDTKGLITAIEAAVNAFGNHLHIDGSEAFKSAVAACVASNNLAVTFDNKELEQRRLSLLAQSKKEILNEHDQSRADGILAGRTSLDAGELTGRHHVDADATGSKPTTRLPSESFDKPNTDGIGRKPATEGHGMHDVSQRGVVYDTSRGEVLLPRDVRHNVDLQRSSAVDRLRRLGDRSGYLAAKTPLPPVGTKPPPKHLRVPSLAALKPLTPIVQKPAATLFDAATAYANERNSKRLKEFDIPNHNRYNAQIGDQFLFAGIRRIQGVPTVLLKVDQDVAVLNIDEKTAQRLQRMKLGDAVEISEKGVRKRKARSR